MRRRHCGRLTQWIGPLPLRPTNETISRALVEPQSAQLISGSAHVTAAP